MRSVSSVVVEVHQTESLSARNLWLLPPAIDGGGIDCCRDSQMLAIEQYLIQRVLLNDKNAVDIALSAST